MRLILTRPEHDAQRTAQLLRAQGSSPADFAACGWAAAAVGPFGAGGRRGRPRPLLRAFAPGQAAGVLRFTRRSADTYVKRSGDAGVLDRALSPVHFCLSAQV